ncbi:MAG: hypothetical protein JWO99_317 [Candidatus Saccharibacteria bacterium]|nr:hypothetical protein [Candidatus Saccharibacteria bacterium]
MRLLDTRFAVVAVPLARDHDDQGRDEGHEGDDAATDTPARRREVADQGAGCARLAAVQTRVRTTVTGRDDRRRCGGRGGGSWRRCRAWRAVERVRPLGVPVSVDYHDLVRVVRSRVSDGRCTDLNERDLAAVNTSCSHHVLDVVPTLFGGVRAERGGVSDVRLILDDGRRTVAGTRNVGGVISHATAVMEHDILGVHRRNGAVERRRVHQIELQRGGSVIAEPVLDGHRIAPVAVDAASITTRVRVVLSTDGTRASEPVHAQPLRDGVVDGVVGRVARRAGHGNDRRVRHRGRWRRAVRNGGQLGQESVLRIVDRWPPNIVDRELNARRPIESAGVAPVLDLVLLVAPARATDLRRQGAAQRGKPRVAVLACTEDLRA